MRKESIKRLLVRAPNWIGDAVMCEPALRGLRGLFPSASITLLARAPIAELFIAHPGIDRTILYDDQRTHAGLTGKWALAGVLRQERAELAVLFQNAFEAAFLTWLAGIPRRFGYATDGRAFFLTDPVAVPERRSPVHQVLYYWHLLRPLGATGDPPAPSLTITRDEAGRMATRLAEAGIGANDAIIGINPGSTYGGAKRWLPERFAEAARRLTRHLSDEQGRPIAVMVLGARGEEALGREIAHRIGGRCVVLSGATTIRELMAATKRCHLLVTNDTGPMHIAAAFGVPVVAVFGPTDWRTTSPYGQEAGIVREPVDCAPCLLRECPIDHRCMTRVSVDRVFETAVKQFERQVVSDEGGEEEVAPPLPRVAGLVSRTAKPPLVGYTVFLDRDGTLNPDPGYIRSPEQYELFPGVAQALAKLKQAGARLVVVTNQSGIARGLLSVDDLDRIHAKLRRLLDAAGASLDGIYWCPHHPDEGCACRKPQPGMIERAVREQGVDPARAYLIGDQRRDMELAHRVGAKSILVRGAGGGDRTDLGDRVPDLVVTNLPEAVEWILADARRRSVPSPTVT